MKKKFSSFVFLVATYQAEDFNSEFLNFLRAEGFADYFCKGRYPNCPWIYVDLNTKYYAHAIPGIKITEVIGNHAITLSEFYTIYNIYKKYEGKSVFVFKSERFDFDD